MKPSQLQLRHYFFTKSVVEAFPKALKMPELPNVTSAVYFRESKGFFVNLEIECGTQGQTEYFVSVHVYGAFEIGGLPDGDELAPYFVRKHRSFASNAVSVLYGSAREQVAMMTSRGPNRDYYLPLVHFDESDIQILLSPEMTALVESFKQPTTAPRKVRRQAIE